MKVSIQTRQTLAILLSLLMLLGLISIIQSLILPDVVTPSSELGFVSFSPRGSSGGAIIPASCESTYEYNHLTGDFLTPGGCASSPVYTTPEGAPEGAVYITVTSNYEGTIYGGELSGANGYLFLGESAYAGYFAPSIAAYMGAPSGTSATLQYLDTGYVTDFEAGIPRNGITPQSYSTAEKGAFVKCMSGCKQSSDGRDNDGDGKVDYPEDPGSSSPSDNDETDGTEYLTPEYLTPGYLTPEYLTPGYLTPEYLTPEYLTPEYLTPEYLTPGYLTPEYLTPEYLTPNTSSPPPTVSCGAVSGAPCYKLFNKGSFCKIEWEVEDAESCAVSRPDGFIQDPATSPFQTPNLNQTSIFTISCQNGDSITSKTFTCRLNPGFQEI